VLVGRLLGCLLLLASTALADPERDFARKISSELAAGDTVSFSIRSRTDLPASELTRLRSALEDEFRPRLDETAPAAVVTITVSENQEGYVWVAEIRRGEKQDVIITARPRPVPASDEDVQTPLSIERKLLWEQQEPVLDLVLDERALVVLEPARLCIYQRHEGRWQRQKTLAFPDGWAAPRDPRGRIERKGSDFQVSLPGLMCAGKLEPVPEMNCQDAATGLVKGRNFFSGPQPHFSFVNLGDQTILAGVDGRTHFDNQTIPGWGSDIAALQTRCGRGHQVLATSTSGAAEPDTLQAFEIVDRQPLPVSPALEFSGPITALWSAQDGATAVAVARNLKTGRYAAFSVSISCAR
jgi:hypothetical protein